MEIAVLLAKDAIEQVPPAEMKSGSRTSSYPRKLWVTGELGSASLEPGLS